MKESITNKQRKQLFSRQPANYAYWYWIVANKKSVKDFLERGSIRQLNCIKRTLKYMKRYRKSRFEEIAGEKILELLKKKRG